MPRGQAGEFCTRGYSVMKGYWNDEDNTREAIDEAPRDRKGGRPKKAKTWD